MQKFILVFTIYCLLILLSLPGWAIVEVPASGGYGKYICQIITPDNIEPNRIFNVYYFDKTISMVELSWIPQNEPIPAIVLQPSNDEVLNRITQQFPKKKLIGVKIRSEQFNVAHLSGHLRIIIFPQDVFNNSEISGAWILTYRSKDVHGQPILVRKDENLKCKIQTVYFTWTNPAKDLTYDPYWGRE